MGGDGDDFLLLLLPILQRRCCRFFRSGDAEPETRTELRLRFFCPHHRPGLFSSPLFVCVRVVRCCCCCGCCKGSIFFCFCFPHTHMQAPQENGRRSTASPNINDDSACRTARVLWHLGNGPEDSIHFSGLGADGLLVGSSTSPGMAIDPELNLCRVDRERRDQLKVYSVDDLYALPHTELPGRSLAGRLRRRRHRFWPPPLSCTAVRPATSVDSLLRSSSSNGGAGDQAVSIDLGISRDIVLSMDVFGGDDDDDFKRGSYAICQYRLPMRLWMILSPPLRVRIGRFSECANRRSELDQMLSHLQARATQMVQPFVLSIAAFQHAATAAGILAWRYPQLAGCVGGDDDDDEPCHQEQEEESVLDARVSITGVPVSCLQAMDLFPRDATECNALVDRICKQIGFPTPCGMWANQSRQQQMTTKRWSRMDLIDIFFPLLDANGWRRAMGKSVGAMAQRPRMNVAAWDVLSLLRSSPQFSCSSSTDAADDDDAVAVAARKLYGFAEDVVSHCPGHDHDHDDDDDDYPAFIVLEAGVCPAGAVLDNSLWAMLLRADVASMLPRRQRGATRRSDPEWHRRIVPIFLMPWVLIFGSAGGEPGVRSTARSACAAMRRQLAQLAHPPSGRWDAWGHASAPAHNSVSKTHRTAADYDEKLLALVMSLVWPDSEQRLSS